MSGESETRWTRRVGELKTAFDGAFALPAQPPAVDAPRVLLLTVGDTPCVVAVEECAGVVPAGAIVRLPSTTSAFRGLTTVRGAVLPVYDLATLLGLEPHPVARPWLLLAAGLHPVAFLAGSVDGYASVPASVSASGVVTAATTSHALNVLTIEGTARRLVALGRIVKSIGADDA
jgi:chemotaxis signal transduction protein